ncbi:MAG: glycoside hydrolase family 15 [Parcubacteria group bacterium]|nr:glycoside hydrolase family 15 [Parcubacteria group bacterium]
MRSIILANGSLLVALDGAGQVRDIYFPHVGLEDHVGAGMRHRIGVFVDGSLSWITDAGWRVEVACEEESLRSAITARNDAMGIELSFTDIVYNESPIFLRRIEAHNLTDRFREVKLYLGAEFSMYRSQGGDTGYYDPELPAIIHYKGERVFLISAEVGGAHFTDYAVGLSGIDGKEGTFRDAEDGHLSKNPVEHGTVDSMLSLTLELNAGETKTAHYWLTAGRSVKEAKELHAYLLHKTPEHLLATTGNYWKAWVTKYDWSFHGLSEKHIALFKKSLMLVRAHMDNDGGIIASADSDMLEYGKDTYAYIWPRDAAYSALTLDRAGDPNIAERFFSFCNRVIDEKGYFMHKYLPDGALGSSWHPWIKDGKPQLPIQEDETALVVYALAEHYRHSRDLEFIESLDNPLLEKAAIFMLEYRDPDTKLPLPSYDLWEEKRGVSTYTAASVFGALNAAADIASVLGKTERAEAYRTAATEVQEAIMTHLYDAESGLFLKMKTSHGEDRTIDISSVYGVFAFGVLPVDDPRLVAAFEKTADRLSASSPHTGIARYEHDQYYAVGDRPNPWFITTLWYAEYLIARAKTVDDLQPVIEIFDWVASHALPSGMLSEQLDATSCEQVSVSPLTWSHSGYASAVISYLEKLEKLGVCVACNPVP